MSSMTLLLRLSLSIPLLMLSCRGNEQIPSPNVSVCSGGVLKDLPDSIDVRARYLFYLHGQIVEDKGPRPEHPQHGVYEYEAICDTLAARGLVVISEARPAGSDVLAYAQKVTGQVERLLSAGLPPEQITVAGHSKGGAIAIWASSLLKNDRVNFVFLACCGDWMRRHPEPDLHGRILSIYDNSDDFAGPCQPAFEKSSHPIVAQEMVIDTGRGHGAFYRPLPEWVEPLVAWTRMDSRQ